MASDCIRILGLLKTSLSRAIAVVAGAGQGSYQSQSGASIPRDQAAVWILKNQTARHGQKPLQGDAVGSADQFILGEKEVISDGDIGVVYQPTALQLLSRSIVELMALPLGLVLQRFLNAWVEEDTMSLTHGAVATTCLPTANWTRERSGGRAS